MNTRENMIIANNRIVTADVRSCNYNNISHKYDITFMSGKTYSYAYLNVVWLRDPQKIDVSFYHFSHNGRDLFDIREAYLFCDGYKEYWHICFENGYEQSYRSSELQVVKSCLSDADSRNVFEYLKHIADATSLRTEDGENLLARQYDKIDFVGIDTALALYLNPALYQKVIRPAPMLIFPFGCNGSQYRAVKASMENQISVIQGPPGTGKTQTILNIIANLLVQGKTVQVVSSNNSATENVLEKLSQDKYGMDFLVAPLGKRENKEHFIQGQTGCYPDLSGWNGDDIDPAEFKKEIEICATELKTVYEKQERLASARQELQAVEVERGYFNAYSNETRNGVDSLPTRRRLRANQVMRLWQESQQLADSEQTPSLFLKLKYQLLYGISDWSFYTRNISDIVAAVQRMYYEQKLNELKSEIQALESDLSGNDAAELQQKFTDMSMRYLRRALFQRYSRQTNRRIFSLDDLWKNSQDVQAEYPIVLSTTFSSRSSLGKDAKFDYLIMDEASQVDVVTGALALSCARNVVIVGDEKQLPNVVTKETRKIVGTIFDFFKVSESYRFSENSFLKSVCLLLPDAPQTLLREHYRCHPKIIEFCNQKFYHGDLVIMTEDHGEEDVISVLKTVTGDHERDLMNQRQIDAVTQEILPEIHCESEEIGIIAPYNNQVDALRRSIPERKIDIATVHKFQGREKDTIILTTVDDEVTDFSDDPYLLNVAVSRARKHLHLVVSGNEQPQDSNISDLVAYIEYHNFQTRQSQIYSVFDFLYRQYTDARREFLKKHKTVSEYDSENLMFALIDDVLGQMPNYPLEVACHMPLNMIIRDPGLLNDEERRYAMNGATHLDFLIYNKVSKKPVLAIEVDGFHYHKEGTVQAERDKKKNHILELYAIPYVRFATNGSGEKEKLIAKLNEILNAKQEERS